MSNDSLLNTTELWCSITNALIKKYKTMAETDAEKCVSELLMLKTLLEKFDILKQEDYD